jgi:hypothetical protein
MDIQAIDDALSRAGLDIPAPIQEGEFTQSMLARLKGVTAKTASLLIASALAAGVFESVGLRRIPHTGTRPREAYRVAKCK